MKKLLIILLSFFTAQLTAQTIDWKNIITETKSSFRGLSVVDNNIAWLGGSKGTVGVTYDGGNTWKFMVVGGYEAVDFRSVYAFDANRVIIANAGTPAYILQTSDGGKNWKVVYQNEHKDAFIDGIDFWNDKKGIVYGDPINGHMLVLRTLDGGNTWALLPENQRPHLKEGEASFAASGTGIRCFTKGKVAIVTGGKVSRIWTSVDSGDHWTALETPIIQGDKMTGIYSVAFKDSKNIIITGGDYDKPLQTTDHIFITKDGGRKWNKPEKATRGMRECVEYASKNIVIAVGQLGSDVSFDRGKSWTALSEEQYFDVVRKARKGTLLLAAGGRGKIAVLKIK